MWPDGGALAASLLALGADPGVGGWGQDAVPPTQYQRWLPWARAPEQYYPNFIFFRNLFLKFFKSFYSMPKRNAETLTRTGHAEVQRGS